MRAAGTPRPPLTSTRRAAAATAASCEYDGSAAGAETYGSWPPAIALTASYTAPWTIARCTVDGAPCPAPAGTAVPGDCNAAAATSFQSVTLSARADAGVTIASTTAPHATTFRRGPPIILVTMSNLLHSLVGGGRAT